MKTLSDVKVIWIDSFSSNQSWILVKDLDFEDMEPIRIETYGKLIKETEEYITVAQNYGIEPEQICNLMTIPKGCIKEIKILNN